MRKLLVAAAASVALAVSTQAFGLVLAPGDSDNTTLETMPYPSGTVLATESQAYSLYGGDLTGTLTSSVIQGENNQLTFAYQLNPDDNFTTSIELATSNFTSFSTNIELLSTIDAVPIELSGTFARTADGSTVSASIDEEAATAVKPAVAEAVFDGFYITTNATSYDNSGTATLSAETAVAFVKAASALPGNPNTTGSFTVYEPVAGSVSVPLPTAVWPGLAGLGALGIFQLRRRRLVQFS